LNGIRPGEPASLVQAFSILIALGDPQAQLIEARSSRPLHYSFDELFTDALPPPAWIDPHRNELGVGLGIRHDAADQADRDGICDGDELGAC
jgi:hypothetical protein